MFTVYLILFEHKMFGGHCYIRKLQNYSETRQMTQIYRINKTHQAMNERISCCFHSSEEIHNKRFYSGSYLIILKVGNQEENHMCAWSTQKQNQNKVFSLARRIRVRKIYVLFLFSNLYVSFQFYIHQVHLRQVVKVLQIKKSNIVILILENDIETFINIIR